jgi:FecR protein
MARVFRRIKCWSIVLIGAMGSSFANADPPDRVARLSLVEGKVSFAPERGNKDDNWSTARTNWPITQANRLLAGKNARAELQVGASALRMAENTSLDFTRLDDERIEAYMERGSLNITLRNWDRDDQLIITTPNTNLVLNSIGRYRIDTDDDEVNIVVRQGEAQIQNGTSRFNAIAGQRVEIKGRDGEDVRISRNYDEDSFDRWAAERDSRQLASNSSRYVAPTTPGVYELDQYGQWQESGEYGPVWRPNNVSEDWAPYRHGRWDWISPWGWTWIDDAPWGYAPSHYGRWVYVDRYWAWHPGRIVARPVYAPALVSFISGPNFSVSVNIGQPCGWVPLAPREVYYPYYQSSHRYVERINFNHVHRDQVIAHEYRHNYNDHRNRDFPGGVTVVDPRVVIDRLPVARAVLPFERNVLRDIARISPPLPPLPGIGRLFPRPIFDQNERVERRRDDDHWRRSEQKFQVGMPAPVQRRDRDQVRHRDDPRSRADYQIPRHEVDTRVPFAYDGQRPLPPQPIFNRERPLPQNTAPLPQNNRPLPQNMRPLPYNDKPLPQNNKAFPQNESRWNGNDGRYSNGSEKVRRIEKWMTNPR